MQSIANMPKYESYKKVDTEWLNKIPQNWELKKVFYLFYAKKGADAARLTKEYCGENEGIYPVYSGQTDNKGIMGMLDRWEFDFSKKGCLFTTTVGAKAMTVSFLQSKFSLSQNCMIIIGRNESVIDQKYFFYAFQPMFFYFRSLIPDHMQASFRMEDLYQYKTILPPKNEQTIIAKFLDQKTAQIDEAIAIKEKQIALLKERKQIMIQKAVTKGLDPNVPMKDSGVEWIGEIPEHWGLLPGFTVYNESKESNIGMKESQVLSLSYGNIVVKPAEKLTGLVPESFETYQVVRPDDIIIRCTDLQNDKNSLRTGISKYLGIITSAYLNIRIKNNTLPKYLHSYFHVLDITKAIYKYGSGLRQNLSFGDFKHMKILQPPAEEQDSIVKYIEIKASEIVRLTEIQLQQIDALKEFKSTLINSAVTGKIKITPDMVSAV